MERMGCTYDEFCATPEFVIDDYMVIMRAEGWVAKENARKHR